MKRIAALTDLEHSLRTQRTTLGYRSRTIKALRAISSRRLSAKLIECSCVVSFSRGDPSLPGKDILPDYDQHRMISNWLCGTQLNAPCGELLKRSSQLYCCP